MSPHESEAAVRGQRKKQNRTLLLIEACLEVQL